MKKLVVTASFTLLGAGAFAQTSAGTMVVSGSVGLSGEGYETQLNGGQANNVNNTSFYVSPSIGTFYRDGLEVGIRPGFSFYRNSYGYEGEESIRKNYIVSLSPYKEIYYRKTLFYSRCIRRCWLWLDKLKGYASREIH